MSRAMHSVSGIAMGASLAVLAAASVLAAPRPPMVAAGADAVVAQEPPPPSEPEVMREEKRAPEEGEIRPFFPRPDGYGRYGYQRYNRYSPYRPYYTRGRISRVNPWQDGFRVWVAGSPYPFYVPRGAWNRERFRVGDTIGIGGYYNPRGYYDYWDGFRDGYSNRRYADRYYGRYRGNNAHSTPDFVGTVVSVNLRADTFVVREDDTGDRITVILRNRPEGDPAPGDYIAVRGDWMSSGDFRAYDIDWLEQE